MLLQGERTGLGKCLPWQEELPDVVVLQELGVVHCSFYLLYFFFSSLKDNVVKPIDFLA